MRPGIARYDGHSDWYDASFSAFHLEEQETLASFLQAEKQR
ncbi:MAG: hypothetical protein ACRDP6_25245 [Actinoallomurus sp.]